MNLSNDHPVFKTTFSGIYPHYITKAEKKGQTKEMVDQVILWLTGYSQAQLDKAIIDEVTLGDFIDNSPKLNPNRHLITGSICGIKVQDLKPGRMQEIRYLDKLVDEVSKGKAMEKIMRVPKELS